MFSVHDPDAADGLEELRMFREDFYFCLTARADALFELVDAVLCAHGPVASLAGLSLVPEHRRGHGAVYDALNCGRVEIARLRTTLAGLPLPRAADGRLVLAVDVSSWLRPDEVTCPRRCFCHTYGRRVGEHQMVPGWPYSLIVALETGCSSWTAPLDAQRLEPGADVLEVTCTQIRDLTERLIDAGKWCDGDPDILIVLDAGYDGPRMAHLLADLPVQILVRLRSDRVFRRPAPPYLFRPDGGRPARHGGEFVFKEPATWGAADIETRTDTRLYGQATALAWKDLHPRLQRRSAWAAWVGPMPILEGTVIRLTVEHLPSGGTNKPVWLWWSGTDATPRRYRSVLANVPAALRYRAYLPDVEADPGLDPPTLTRPRGGRPLDLADAHRLYTVTVGPPPGRRSAPALGETPCITTAHTRPSAARVSTHPHEDRHSRRCTETFQTWARTPA
ncbi:transposase [Nocardia sp. NPDC088792]|uniref:transposase n=1 Tax=Nocardia sp. NPDC088792 TaxID=3364332 RepID=UPI0037FDED55